MYRAQEVVNNEVEAGERHKVSERGVPGGEREAGELVRE